MRFSKIEIALIVIASDDDSVFAAKLFLQLLVNLVGETRWRDAGRRLRKRAYRQREGTNVDSDESIHSG